MCGFEGTYLFGPVAQLVRAPPCHGGGRGFESHPGRFRKELKFNKYIWDLSSAGRASALQAEGHRFKSCRSHLCRRGGTGRRTGLKILRDLYSRIGSIPIAGIMRKQIRHRFFEVYAFFVI